MLLKDNYLQAPYYHQSLHTERHINLELTDNLMKHCNSMRGCSLLSGDHPDRRNEPLPNSCTSPYFSPLAPTKIFHKNHILREEGCLS